jgi:hypothetical protein
VNSELRDEVVAICNAIDVGDVAPRDGAARIWALLAEADYPAETDEFRVFVGMVSELQDDPQHETDYEAAIRDEASAVLARYPRA